MVFQANGSDIMQDGGLWLGSLSSTWVPCPDIRGDDSGLALFCKPNVRFTDKVFTYLITQRVPLSWGIY